MKRLVQTLWFRLLVLSVLGFGMYAACRSLDNTVALWLEHMLSYVSYPCLQTRSHMLKPFKRLEAYMYENKSARAEAEYYRELYEQSCANTIKTASDTLLTEQKQELIAPYEYTQNQNCWMVQVVGHCFSDTEHTILVDAGIRKGITVDMVAVHKNCLIGRVTQVYPHYSRIALITDPCCKVAAICAQSRDCGIHEGRCNFDHTVLTYVFDTRLDLDKRLHIGEVVISSGEGLVFPRGFGLGRVREWHKRDLECEVILEPLLDLRAVNFCCLVTKEAVCDFIKQDLKTTNTCSEICRGTRKKQTNSPIEASEVSETSLQNQTANSLKNISVSEPTILNQTTNTLSETAPIDSKTDIDNTLETTSLDTQTQISNDEQINVTSRPIRGRHSHRICQYAPDTEPPIAENLTETQEISELSETTKTLNQ